MVGVQLAFLNESVQVCSGWDLEVSWVQLVLNDIPLVSGYNANNYLIKRGTFVQFMGVVGFGLLLIFIWLEHNRRKKRSVKPSISQQLLSA